MVRIIEKNGKKVLVGTKKELGKLASADSINLKTAQEMVGESDIDLGMSDEEVERQIRDALGLDDPELGTSPIDAMDGVESADDVIDIDGGPSDEILQSLESMLGEDGSGLDTALTSLDLADDDGAIVAKIQDLYKKAFMSNGQSFSKSASKDVSFGEQEFLDIWGDDPTAARKALLRRNFVSDFFKKK